MPKIMVLNNEELTWDMLEGCMIITLAEEELKRLVDEGGKFSADVPIMEQQTLSERDTDWEAVCGQFYHACGGQHGCGDVDWVDSLIKKYHSYFEDSMEDDGFWYEEEE